MRDESQRTREEALTIADKVIIDNLTMLHEGDGPPRVRHGVSYESAQP